MWPFKKRKLPTVTNAAYERWLRAHRPSWVWFFCLGDAEQETLALIGDAHAERAALDIGYAVADPQIAEAGIAAAAGDADAEATLAKRMAVNVAASILRQRGAQPEAPRRPPNPPKAWPTMKGVAR